MQWSSLLLMLAALALLPPRLARADAAPDVLTADDPERAAALEAVQRGDLTDAHARCTRLHAARPGGASLHCMGVVALARHEYPEAITLLRRALADVGRPLAEVARGDAEDALARAEGRVAQLRIEANPMPTAALVDGAPVPLRDGVLVLTPGARRVTLRAPGRLAVTQQVTVTGGERGALRVALPAAPESDGRASSARASWHPRAWLWSGVGVFVAAAAVGLAVGMSRETVTERPIAEAPFATAKGP